MTRLTIEKIIHSTMRGGRFAVLVASIALAPSLWAGHTLKPQEQRVLDKWLKKYPDLRIATDADCNCAEEIRQMRSGYGGKWAPVPDYHPYLVTGDFNSDGVRDFAVVVVITSKAERNFTLAVFNGPFGPKADSPAFYEPNLDLRGEGLFFGPPRPKPYRLVLGAFESDSGDILDPRGPSYKLITPFAY